MAKGGARRLWGHFLLPHPLPVSRVHSLPQLQRFPIRWLRDCPWGQKKLKKKRTKLSLKELTLFGIKGEKFKHKGDGDGE